MHAGLQVDVDPERPRTSLESSSQMWPNGGAPVSLCICSLCTLFLQGFLPSCPRCLKPSFLHQETGYSGRGWGSQAT